MKVSSVLKIIDSNDFVGLSEFYEKYTSISHSIETETQSKESTQNKPHFASWSSRYIQENDTQNVKNAFNSMKQYAENNSNQPLYLPPTLTGPERKRLHELAEGLNLSHETDRKTENNKKTETLKIEKLRNYSNYKRLIQINSDLSMISLNFVFTHYFYLTSPLLTYYAYRYISIYNSLCSTNDIRKYSPIPLNWIYNQEARDDHCHHMTIITKKEVQSISKVGISNECEVQDSSNSNKSSNNKHSKNKKSGYQDPIQTEILSNFGRTECDWKVLGLGHVVDPKTQNEAYFLVVDWPQANEIRSKLFNFPKKDFHITVAFSLIDIHELPKDQSTIIFSENDLKNHK